MVTRVAVDSDLGIGGRGLANEVQKIKKAFDDRDTDLAVVEAAWALIGGPIATTAALSLLATAVDGRLYYVTAVGIYYYDAASVATVDSPRVLAATGMAGVGRYISIAEEADVHARIHTQVADLAALAAMTDAVDGQFVFVAAAGPYAYSAGFPGPADSPRIVEATTMGAGYFLKLEPSMERHAVIHNSVATTAAMQALTTAVDGCLVNTLDHGLYRYDAASVGPTSGLRVLEATGMGPTGFYIQLAESANLFSVSPGTYGTLVAMAGMTIPEDGMLFYVTDVGFYRYSATSVVPTDSPYVVAPTAMGVPGKYHLLLDAYLVRGLIPLTTDSFLTTDAALGAHDGPLYIDLDMGDGSRCGVLNAIIPSAADINPGAVGTDSVRVVHAAAPTGVPIFSDGAAGWVATLPTGRDAYFISAEGKKYPVLFDIAPPATPVCANDDVVEHFSCDAGTGDFNETSVLVP